VKDAEGKLSSLLDHVEAGEEVIITRHGREVARLVPIQGKAKPLPSLVDFRSSIHVTGEPLSATVIRGRNEDRY
jgi:prevent-host-death family protein